MGIFRNVKNKSAEESTHQLGSEGGGFKVRKLWSRGEDSSNVPKNDSYVLIQDWWGSLIRFWHNHIIVRTPGDYTTNVGSNRFESTKGDAQRVIGGDSRKVTLGDEKQVKGKQNEKEIEAAKKLNDINKKVQKARADAAEQNKTKQPCPVCNQRHLVDRMSDNLISVFDTIEKYLGLVIPFKCFPFDIIALLLSLLAAPFLSLAQNFGLRGKGCQSPGCKDAMVEVPNLKKVDKAGADAIKAEQANISKWSKQLASGGSETVTYKTDVMVKIGLQKNDPDLKDIYREVGSHTFPMRWVPSENKPDVLAYDSKGSAKRVLFLPPQRTQGSWMYDVANNFTINAGAPGIDLQTSGQLTADVGSISLKAGSGEAYIGSNNVTTIKGKNVIIDASDSSGDAGVVVQSPHTMFQGSLNVRGDVAFKGHLTTDGALSTPHLIVPSMRTESTTNATSKFKTEGANWAAAACVINGANLAKDVVLRYVFPGYITTMAGVVALATEVYDLINTCAQIEPFPTGIYAGFCANAAGPGVSWGLIWNFKHNHIRAGEDHSHTVTSPKASYWNTRRGWGGERMAGSPIPTPAPGFGDSMSPGPKSKSGGSCGGGGLWTKIRNDNYNLGDDPFNGGNYVPAPIIRQPDGTILPTPQFSYLYSCVPYTSSLYTTTFVPSTGNFVVPVPGTETDPGFGKTPDC
jgi:hypothetical protein